MKQLLSPAGVLVSFLVTAGSLLAHPARSFPLRRRRDATVIVKSPITAIRWSFTASLLAALAAAVAYVPAVRAQPALQGTWQTLSTQMPINPVHAALTNDGRVLIVSGS